MGDFLFNKIITIFLKNNKNSYNFIDHVKKR